MKNLRRIFITGFLVLVPVLATVDLIWWFIGKIEGWTREYIPQGLFSFDFYGLGLLLSIVIIFIVGLLTENYFGKWAIRNFDKILNSFPLVGGLYKAIKQFLQTIFDSKKDQFKKAVLAEFPREGVYSIGFLTGEPDERLVHGERKKMINVFFPMTPNPTSGFYVLMPMSQLTPLEMPVPEAFKILISMGIIKSQEPLEHLDAKS